MDIKVNEDTVVVFDLDDTLYNELDYLRSAYIQISKEIDKQNWRFLFSKIFSLYRCNEDVFGWIAQNHGIEKNKLIHIYRNHQPSIHLFEGALDLLKAIKIKKGKIGIITDGRTTTQNAKIKALGIAELIDCIVISEEIGTEKPNEQNYKQIENAFQEHSYLYIADNFRKDFTSPNKLGWQTIGLVDNGLNIHHDTHKYISDKALKPKKLALTLKEINPV